MAAVATCKQIPSMVVGDKGYISVSFDPVLPANVTLTGTPTISEVTTTDFGSLATPSIYTGLALTGMKWSETNLTLTKVGAFAGYDYIEGDTIDITSGTGATTGVYLVSGKLNDSQISLEETISASTTIANMAGTLSASKRILGEPIKPSRSVDCFLNAANATAGTTYRFRITVTTTENSNTGVRIRDVLVKVIAEGSD